MRIEFTVMPDIEETWKSIKQYHSSCSIFLFWKVYLFLYKICHLSLMFSHNEFYCFKKIVSKYFNVSSVLISNMINLDRCKPHQESTQ